MPLGQIYFEVLTIRFPYCKYKTKRKKKIIKTKKNRIVESSPFKNFYYKNKNWRTVFKSLNSLVGQWIKVITLNSSIRLPYPMVITINNIKTSIKCDNYTVCVELFGYSFSGYGGDVHITFNIIPPYKNKTSRSPWMIYYIQMLACPYDRIIDNVQLELIKSKF